MECPHCRKYIKRNEDRCDYCGGIIKKTFFRRLSELLFTKRISKERFFDSIESGRFRGIGSPEELELYVEHETGDKEVAVIVRDVLERAGRGGLIDVKWGGSGNPYRIEYFSGKLSGKMSAEETDRRRKELEARYPDHGTLPDADERFKQGLLELTRNYVIIWINAASKDVFEARRQVVMSALQAVPKSIGGEVSDQTGLSG